LTSGSPWSPGSSDKLEANNGFDRSFTGNDRREVLPTVFVESVVQRIGRDLRAHLMLWRPCVGLWVLTEFLDNADHAVNIRLDAVVGDNRLIAVLQLLDFVRGPLIAVIIAIGLVFLVPLAAFGGQVVLITPLERRERSVLPSSLGIIWF
jgi:hypothetical protein